MSRMAVLTLANVQKGAWFRKGSTHPTGWRLIKSAFSRSVATGERISDSRAAKGERGIWQRRYWEHTIRDESDFAHHMDYIHINPVKHGLVARAVFVVPSYGEVRNLS